MLLKSGPNSKELHCHHNHGAPCQSLVCLFPRGIFPQQGPAGNTMVMMMNPMNSIMMNLTMMLKKLPFKGSYKGDLSNNHQK